MEPSGLHSNAKAPDSKSKAHLQKLFASPTRMQNTLSEMTMEASDLTACAWHKPAARFERASM